MSKGISVLGSTGSVGTATIDVIKANPDLFHVQALTANKNVGLLAQQAIETNAKMVAIADENLYADLKDSLSGKGIEVVAGEAGVVEAASIAADCTMAAIMGMAGLKPLLTAIRNGKHVAIANKEPLVAAGKMVTAAAAQSGAILLPVDSEHNAVFQVFKAESKDSIRRIILTASGGPFREWTSDQMAKATPAQALAHPNWVMGKKISIDSATMMNKALEIIEAHHLFDLPPEKIETLIHPQSIVHSMVEYEDGSVLAQMGAADMRVPITHALGWPKRIGGPAQRLDFTAIPALTFAPIDHCRFPAINLAYDCLKEGLGACISFNAANEVAVEAFLAGAIGFSEILDIVRNVVEQSECQTIDSLENIVYFDSEMRKAAQTYIVNKIPQSNTNPDRKIS